MTPAEIDAAWKRFVGADIVVSERPAKILRERFAAELLSAERQGMERAAKIIDLEASDFERLIAEDKPAPGMGNEEEWGAYRQSVREWRGCSLMLQAKAKQIRAASSE